MEPIILREGHWEITQVHNNGTVHMADKNNKQTDQINLSITFKISSWYKKRIIVSETIIISIALKKNSQKNVLRLFSEN